MKYEMKTEYKRSASLDQNEVPLAVAGVRKGVLNFTAPDFALTAVSGKEITLLKRRSQGGRVNSLRLV